MTLTTVLFGQSVALPDLPIRKDIHGIGLTDWSDYAPRLTELFSYENTFYHEEPRLDISDPAISPDLLNSQDFLISSDVFEHVVPPVDRSLRNVWRILKPGGFLVLTVPYAPRTETVEHFPDLNEFTVSEQGDGTFVLRNVTAAGEIQEFNQLIFHGGPGATLEMRVFGEGDLLVRLRDAGFTEVRIHRTDFTHGIWWPENWSLPISARKPLDSK